MPRSGHLLVSARYPAQPSGAFMSFSSITSINVCEGPSFGFILSPSCNLAWASGNRPYLYMAYASA